MILNFLANNILLPRDIFYFCTFAGMTTIILYVFYMFFMKGKIEE